MPSKGTYIEIVKNDLPSIADNIGKGAEQVVRETVLFIEGQAKSDVVVGPTGALAAGIQSETQATATGFRGEVADVTEYAAYVNYGTGSRGQSSSVPDRSGEITYTGSWLGMTARPFMSQAAHDGRLRFEKGMAKVVHA